VSLKKTIEFGHTEAVKKAVESGLGIGILSKLSIVREEYLGLIKSLRLEGRRSDPDIFLCLSQGQISKPGYEDFFAVCRLWKGRI